MKRIIAIVAGGDSSEYEVSLRSAEGILSSMDKDRYECYITLLHGTTWEAIMPDGTHQTIDRNDFSFETPAGRVRPDFAYITIHGTPGENGILQGYFDLIHMPYSTSGVLVEALTFNKFCLNQYLKTYGVRVAESMLIRRGKEDMVSDADIVERVGLPCFVKSNTNGSSFGVTKVKTEAGIRPAIATAMADGGDAIIESFLDGTEVTCGCYKTQSVEHIFPITEVVTNEEFFNYEAKYNGASDEITPARIAPETADRVSRLTSAIYEILGCEGIIRVDYILTGEKGHETINMLEVNTTPGMTAASFIPQQVRAAGLEMSQVLSDIIENKF